jgi:hypothetical protein
MSPICTHRKRNNVEARFHMTFKVAAFAVMSVKFISSNKVTTNVNPTNQAQSDSVTLKSQH